MLAGWLDPDAESVTWVMTPRRRSGVQLRRREERQLEATLDEALKLLPGYQEWPAVKAQKQMVTEAVGLSRTG
jgi:hypothetical protein